jgi:nicotinamide mononucleotide adenylyltransferase
MEYLLEGKKRCEFLYVGVSNPDPTMTRLVSVNPHRSETSSNPFTYYERAAMLTDSLIDEQIPHNEFEVVPFPINVPELLRFYVPLSAVFFVTIYDEWGEYKLNLLKSLGLQTEVMWKRKRSELFTSGESIRRIIKEGGEWNKLVPKAVYNYVKNHNLEERVRNL